MYTANHRIKKRRIFLKFVIFFVPILVVIGVAIWFVLLRDNSTSSNFSKAGAEIAYVVPATKDFTNQYFKITLPSTWADLGRKNPFSNQVYYEYQNLEKDYDNRWLRVYVDVYPTDFAITRLLAVKVVNNRLVANSNWSEECKSFTGAPITQSGQSGGNWIAKWEGVSFYCDMNTLLNYLGTGSVDEGYGVTLVNNNGTKHKYFFVYIDHNVRPDYNILKNAVSSFEVR
jgi:hypothetical protein